MQQPLQITFQGMGPSDVVVDDVRAGARRLQCFHDRITSCRVVVEAPHRHPHAGVVYGVRVQLCLPTDASGKERHVYREHGDVFLAIRDAFDAARLQLESVVAQGRSRHHVFPPLQ